MKRILTVLTSLLLTVCAMGCSARPLPGGLTEEDVERAAKGALEVILTEDYDAVVSMLRPDLADAISASDLEDAWAPAFEALGAFENIEDIVCMGTYDKGMAENFATAVVSCSFAEGTAIFTLSFDCDLYLCGLYMRTK